MTVPLVARSGHVLTVADESVEFWLARGYKKVVAPPAPKKTPTRRSSK